MHRPCRRRAPPVPIARCVRPCYSCRCCCWRCRGIPARAARPVLATMGPANSVMERGSSIRRRKRRRQALRIEHSTAKAVSARFTFRPPMRMAPILEPESRNDKKLRLTAQGSGNLQTAMKASFGCAAHVREHGPPAISSSLGSWRPIRRTAPSTLADRFTRYNETRSNETRLDGHAD